MDATLYRTTRRSLLQAAAWHGYVQRRGLNAEQGAEARKANQRALADIRRARRTLPSRKAIVPLPVDHRTRWAVDAAIADAWAFLCRRFEVAIVYGNPMFDTTPATMEFTPWGNTIIVRPTLTIAQQNAAIAHYFAALAARPAGEWNPRVDGQAMRRDVARAALAS